MRKTVNLFRFLGLLKPEKLTPDVLADHSQKMRISRTIRPDRNYTYDEIARHIYLTLRDQYGHSI